MGKVIGFFYTLKNGEGVVIDSNLDGSPMEFVTDKGHIIPKLEQELKGMEVGEKRQVIIQPAEGYGNYNPQLVEVRPREEFETIHLQKGMQLYGQTPDGETFIVTVKDFDNKSVVIDYNHPLAGETLIFDVELILKRDATLSEQATGEVETSHHHHSCNCDSCSC